MLPPNVNHRNTKERQREMPSYKNNTSGTNQQVKLNINRSIDQSCNTMKNGILLYHRSQNSNIVTAKKVGLAADTQPNEVSH
jgi:hypothetical protein